MKRHLFYIMTGVFLLCVALTMAGITNLLVIPPHYLNALFGLTMLEVCAAFVALLRSTRFFDDSLVNNLNDYIPSDSAARILATLNELRAKTPLGNRCKFGLPTTDGDFPRYILGVAELINLGLLNLNVEDSKLICSLTSVGERLATKLENTSKKAGTYLSNR